jgi:hypothetical protein
MAYKLIFEERSKSTETLRTVERPSEIPAPYFLAEILSLHRLSPDERRQIHKAKLAYGDVRLWQDG